MTRKDFYNDLSRERHIDFLADIRLVRRVYCSKYNLTQGDMELLWKLHSLGEFILPDFQENVILCNWNKDRWGMLKREGWIDTKRERNRKENNYNVYELSEKGKKMVNRIYKHLCGELALPVDPRSNPIMGSEQFQDKQYAKSILAFNKALKAKRLKEE